MKTILVIAGDLNPQDLGGAETHVVEIVRRLKKRYHFIVLVGKNKKIGQILGTGVEIVPVSYWRVPNLYGFLFCLKAIFVAIPKLHRSKPSLIWAKQEFPYAIPTVVLGKLFSIPTFVTVQNPQSFSQEMVLGRFMKLIEGPINFIANKILSLVLSRATLVAVVSGYSQNLSIAMGVTKTIIIPNGVDLKKFRRQNRKILLQKHGKIKIVTTSTLIPRNAVDITIRAISQLPGNIDCQFLVAGSGPEKNNLIRLATQLEVRSKIRFLGTLDNNDVVGLLKNADIFVRPSRFEGFGNSFLEAMAMGVPVVTTASGGQVDFIKDRVTGIVVPQDDPSAVTSAILQLINNRTLTQSIITKGKNLVQRNYDWQIVVRKVDQAFQILTN